MRHADQRLPLVHVTEQAERKNKLPRACLSDSGDASIVDVMASASHGSIRLVAILRNRAAVGTNLFKYSSVCSVQLRTL
jgi:hypothetical protein